MTTNIFEYATRYKLRFASIKGELNAEQLWDVPLRSGDGFHLNAVAKAANDKVKELNEENFVETTRTSKHVRAEAALEVVKHIIQVKVDAENLAKRRAEDAKEEEMLLQALANKQGEKLAEKTEDQIKKRLAAIKAGRAEQQQ